jgi:predicted patatin/cPLA2 family phospholipase
MLDGGISDSIPLQRAIDMGHTFNVVVLTRNEGYRSNSNFYRRSAFLYRKYPALRRTLERRREMYNEQISFVEEMERHGKALVIRPQRPLEVSRLCTDTAKMMRLYEEGYNEAKRVFTDFLRNE